MKVGRLTGRGSVGLEDVPSPSAGSGEIVVELAACGVCGTDLEKLRGNYQTKGILGHEPVGVVVERAGDVHEIALGQRVFVHHHVPCYHCPVCEQGAYTFCPEYSSTNIDPGGFSERFRVPKVNVDRHAVLPLDSSVSWEAGAVLEPSACALTALHRVGFRPGQSVFVAGLGPVGLLYARLAQALGASWVGGTELSELRRTFAERGGVQTFHPKDAAEVQRAVRASTRGVGADLSVVAVGAPSAVALALAVCRRGGTLNLFGLPAPHSQLAEDLQSLYLSGVAIVPTYATTESDIAEVHRLLATGRLHAADLVTHHFPLSEIGSAFAAAERPQESVKVVVTGPAFH